MSLYQEPRNIYPLTSLQLQDHSSLVSSFGLSPQHPLCDMSNQSETSSLLSALGTLIGYIGSEAATEDVFERLLWPQRFFNAITWRDALQIGLLNPMGGPIHKAALVTLDKFHRNGLFKGRNLGNMLGTAFFHDMGLKYKMHSISTGSTMKEAKEHVRNGLWVQAIARIPIESKGQKESHPETGEKHPKLIRAKSVVSLLELSYVDENSSEIDRTKIVKHDTGRVAIRTYLTLIWSEITGLATGGFVIGYWRSYLSFIWFLPLALKFLSAATTIEREGLLAMPSRKEKGLEDTKHFEVNTKGQGFLVVEGKESVVLQFFRHYGHPMRNRPREFIQISIIIASGFVFPIGLVCSLVWMPIGMQYAWLGYQLYATGSMYVYRYTRGHQWATTEARLAQMFARGHSEERIAYLQDESGTMVMGKLTRIPVGRYAEGQKFLKDYLAQKPAVYSKEKEALNNERSDGSETLCDTPNDSENNVDISSTEGEHCEQ